MPEIFRLIRFRTIAFAAFTMYAMRYFVIRPILDINGFSIQMSDFAFTLLILSVCSLIAGAYVINDYFDTKTDRISKIRDVLVGRSISRRTAITLHTILNIIAITIAFYLSYAVGIWKIGILFVLVSGILWFYSSCYKKYLFIGNIIVGALAALIPLSVIVFEIPLLNMAYADLLLETETDFLYMFNWILGFSFFTFFNTLIYEINKDIYTIDGDRENEINTISVKYGTATTRRIIAILTATCMLSVALLYFFVFSSSLAILIYAIIALELPYAIYLISILSRAEKRKFQLRMIRLITVLCVAFSLLLNHFFQLIFAE